MSNYTFKARLRSTGKVFDIDALDNYFGRREYGYRIYDWLNPSILKADKFHKLYEAIQ